MDFHDFPRFPSLGREVSHPPPKVMRRLIAGVGEDPEDAPEEEAPEEFPEPPAGEEQSSPPTPFGHECSRKRRSVRHFVEIGKCLKHFQYE